ncbi:MAG: hypothetical protein AAGF12_30635, partial [Myxococcota bacterium]
METTESFLDAFKSLAGDVDTPALDPDPSRPDWAQYEPQLTSLRERTQSLLASLEGALLQVDDLAVRARLKEEFVLLAGEVGALHIAAGRADVGNALLRQALALAPGPQRLELECAEREPEPWMALVRGRWLLRQGRFDDADRVLREGRKLASDTDLKKAIDEALATPRPLSGAPNLFTLNGVGTMLYGQRGHSSDGSYIATLFFTLVFIPVMPLTAYRVVSQGDGGYLFLAKEQLTKVQRWWRLSVPLMAVMGAVALSVGVWWASPERKASGAVADAVALEEQGDGEAALQAYNAVLREYSGVVDEGTLAPAAAGTIRVLAGRIEEPLTAGRVDEVTRLVVRYEQLPPRFQGGEALDLLLARAERWAGQVGHGSIEDAEASLRVLREVERLSTSPTPEFLRRVASVELGLADALATDWPIYAVELYSKHPDDDHAVAQGARLLARLADKPSVLVELEPQIERFANAATGMESGRAALEAAKSALEDPARATALTSNDPEALAAALARFPGDQRLTIALAELRRADGEPAEALELLEACGSLGELLDEALTLHAACAAEVNRLEDADRSLSRLVSVRLPNFTEAQRNYGLAANRLVDAIHAQLDRGVFPSDLDRRLQGTFDEARQQEIFQEWLGERVDTDPELMALRAAYEAQSSVVPAALTLGTIKLRRAAGVSGEAKEQLLVEAERAFLAIQGEAEGVPSYHMGLGQVYHRLGKVEEGEAELEALLASGDPDIVLSVAAVYRELGLVGRAREVAEDVFSRGAQPFADSAASFLAVVSDDLDEKEEWLGRLVEADISTQKERQQSRGPRELGEGGIYQTSALFYKVA